MNNTKIDDNPDSHDSCVASKAVGLINGVYNTSKSTVVKIAYDIPFTDIVWAFNAILADIRNNDEAKPAVVALPPFQMPIPTLFQGPRSSRQ